MVIGAVRMPANPRGIRMSRDCIPPAAPVFDGPSG